MIYDSIQNAPLYAGISPNLKTAMEALTKTDFDALAPGRYTVDGEKVFFMVQECTLNDGTTARYERHARYIDIQLSLSGNERIDCLPVSELSFPPFPEGSDGVFAQTAPAGIPLIMRKGTFAVLFPQDAHMPCLSADGTAKGRKVVFKVEY